MTVAVAVVAPATVVDIVFVLLEKEKALGIKKNR